MAKIEKRNKARENKDYKEAEKIAKILFENNNNWMIQFTRN